MVHGEKSTKLVRSHLLLLQMRKQKFQQVRTETQAGLILYPRPYTPSPPASVIPPDSSERPKIGTPWFVPRFLPPSLYTWTRETASPFHVQHWLLTPSSILPFPIFWGHVPIVEYMRKYASIIQKKLCPPNKSGVFSHALQELWPVITTTKILPTNTVPLG